MRTVLGSDIAEKSRPAEAGPTRPRDRKKTSEELEAAIQEIQQKGLPITVVAVARHIGVSPGLIHNTYGEIAEKIRKLTGRTAREKMNLMAEELKKMDKSLKELRVKLSATQDDFKKMASINETLRDELATARAQASGKVAALK
ncbi:MAG: TetR family transcriptional regulator [Burkholderiales bacterium]|nr:TetR family transcriptional regulator [Burkholderiales bacterium]